MAVTVATDNYENVEEHETGTHAAIRDGHLFVQYWAPDRISDDGRSSGTWAPVAIYAPGQWTRAVVTS